MTEKFNPIFKLVEADTPFNITSELKETFGWLNKALSDARDMSLKHILRSGLQLVLMTDATLKNAEFALSIEVISKWKKELKRDFYAFVVFGLKMFSLAQIKVSLYWKEFLAIEMAFLDFAHFLFFVRGNSFNNYADLAQTSHMVLRNGSLSIVALERMRLHIAIHFQNSKKAHIEGIINTAADSFSRLQLKVKEKIRLKTQGDI